MTNCPTCGYAICEWHRGKLCNGGKFPEMSDNEFRKGREGMTSKRPGAKRETARFAVVTYSPDGYRTDHGSWSTREDATRAAEARLEHLKRLGWNLRVHVEIIANG